MQLGVDRHVTVSAFAVAFMLLAGHKVSAAPYIWQGDGDDATGVGVPATDPGEAPSKDWNAANNWSPESIPGINDTVTFGTPLLAGASNVTYNAPVAAASITVNTATFPYEIEGYGAGKLTLAAGGSITLGNDTPGVAFRGPMELNGSASIASGTTNSSFNFTNATITGLAAGTLTATANIGTANALGAIHGPLKLYKAGGSALTLNGATSSTYTGGTQLTGAQTIVAANNALPTDTIVTLGDTGGLTGVFRVNGNITQTIGGLQVAAGAGASSSNQVNGSDTANAANLVINANSYSRFTGRFGASGAASQNINLTKIGSAAFTLSNTVHTFTGSITVTGGTFEVDGTGDINTGSGITLNGGQFVYNSSVAYTKPVTFTSGTIGGTGNINTAISIGANGTISPGSDVDQATGNLITPIGTQNYQAGLTFAPDGTYHYDVNASTGDLLTVTGALNLNATSADPFVIDLFTDGLTPLAPYQRTIASAGSIGGFSADKFVVNNAIGGTVSQVGNTLVLSFTAVPEPAGLGLLAVCGAALMGRRRQQ
jgi:autotransporter-associated beta strand protein